MVVYQQYHLHNIYIVAKDTTKCDIEKPKQDTITGMAWTNGDNENNIYNWRTNMIATISLCDTERDNIRCLNIRKHWDILTLAL